MEPDRRQLVGYGVCTRIQPSGVDDDFDLIGTQSSELVANSIDNLYVVDTGNKAAGFGIYGVWVNKLDISNVVIDHPYSGISLTDFNDVRIAHDRVFQFFGQQGNLLALRSDATNASCCLNGIDFYGFSNGGPRGDLSAGQIGYLIDGDVATIIARNFDLSDIAGSGMVVSNVVGNASPPQFIQFSDFGAEYMTGRGVDLEAGLNIGFSGTSLVHAAGYDNFVSCSSSADLYVANGVTLWAWDGPGGLANASGDNVYVAGQEGKLYPQKVVWGSGNQRGTPGQCPGVEFGSTAAYVALSGAQIGDGLHPTWQAEPVLLDSGASNIVAVGNTFAGNLSSTVVDNSGSITNVLVANANDTTPGWAFDHVHTLFGIGTGSPTYANNGSVPGMAILQANNGSSVRASVINTGTGTADADIQWATPNTGSAFALCGNYSNSGSPYFPCATGSGDSAGITLNSSAATAAPVTLTGGSTGGVVVSNLSTAGLVTTTSGGKLGSEASATVAQGGTGSASGALSVWSCVIADTSGASTNWCPWKAANTAVASTYFDEFTVSFRGTCSTTYPIVAIYDVTQSSALGSTTVPGTGTTITSVNASASGATATDQYAFRVTTAGSGCSSALATEFIDLTASMRN